MLLAGIDASTRRVAIVSSRPDGSDSDYHVIEVRRSKDPFSPAHLVQIEHEVWRWISKRGIESVVIESPVVGRGGVLTALKLAYAIGAVQIGAAKGASESVNLVNVQSWKRSVVGNGNATKEDVGKAVAKRWPAMFKQVAGDLDLTDAAAICIYGHQAEAE